MKKIYPAPFQNPMACRVGWRHYFFRASQCFVEKRCWIYLLAFSFLIFLISYNSFSIQSNVAIAKAYSITENLSASSVSQQEINYELPYPGLLPDSPLYFLRVTRDKIVSFLISDPLKKSEFDLLQADKRLNAGIFIFNKGKILLSITTISKAENYFEEALSEMENAKMQGRNISEIKGKLSSAVKKHEQELINLAGKVNVNFKPGFEKELKRVGGFNKRLNR